jgi:hypothetical protein
VRSFLQRRAGLLIGASWALAFFVWWILYVFADQLEYWIYCGPRGGAAAVWRIVLPSLFAVKAINVCVPVVATAIFPRERYRAGRAALAAILVSLLIFLGALVCVATQYQLS